MLVPPSLFSFWSLMQDLKLSMILSFNFNFKIIFFLCALIYSMIVGNAFARPVQLSIKNAKIKLAVDCFSSLVHFSLSFPAIAQQGLFRKIINHRRRKALPPNYSKLIKFGWYHHAQYEMSRSRNEDKSETVA